MRENKKKGKGRSDLGVGAERAASAQLGDGSSSKLRKTAAAVGNEELKQRIENQKANRDDLLQFIVDRLQKVREVQLKELDVGRIRRQREWWKDVSDIHKEDATKPKPTRWREVARIYEEAAYQLCRGALGRGKMLVERGIDLEKKTFGDLTKLVDSDDEDIDTPDAMASITSDEACPADNVPQEIHQLSNEIQNVTHVTVEPPGRKRKRDPWWTLWEEEEEEEEGEPAA
jgi:hypothetical protein